MPLHPLENFPESLRQQNIVNEYYSCLSEANEDQMKELGTGGLTGFTSNLNSADATFHIPSGHPISTLMKQAKVECLTWKLLTFVQTMWNKLTVLLLKFTQQGDSIDSIAQAKATVNEVTAAAQQAMYNQPSTLSQIQEREADIRALAELSRALDKKASATRLVPYFCLTLMFANGYKSHSSNWNLQHLCFLITSVY